ncbi:MAG: HD domain-containing protein [Clostridia bacterium]|nr:HD domain-containing protein [Clostridia bacterium]
MLRFEQQLLFLKEIEGMKQILRQTMLADYSRRENDAEHSWHFAVMAMILAEYADPEVNLCRVLKMALVHDLVEVYAGDTFAYDEQGNRDKEQREQQAADRIFGMLPEDQGKELRSLLEEFDAMKTKDALYAACIDRLQPFINNYYTQGHTWRRGGVTPQQVYQRMEPVKRGTPKLWEFVEFVIEDGKRKGYFVTE